ncbi:MAG: hypothetical protein BZ137_08710 [Methanosphaera sp. rholeuAM130]|nr:MAG: hypothetical protein BZ137_08710 [Methanosphaera sp. rholeuAM130]
MIFDILKDALDYLGTNRNQIIVYYLGILIFPLVLIESYSYHIIENCLKGMINNKDKLPDMTINAKSFMNGLKLLILKIIYYLPEIIILTIAVNLNQIDYIYLTILLVILTIISYSLSQIAGVCMVDSGLFNEGFNFPKIFNIIKSVGLTYVEFIIATLVIILGIIGVTILLTGIILIIGSTSSTLQAIFIFVLTIVYIIFLIVIVPIYALFKNRAVASIYNLS